MKNYSLQQLSQALLKGEFSSRELTEYYLKRINQYQQLNAFISIDEEGALEAATQSDQRLRKKMGQRLIGIPMAHKDNLCTQTLATTCASKMLKNFYSPYEATVVKKLRDSGCIMLGKTNMDEFAMGSSNETSYFGACYNPWDLKMVPGGSSGGSAIAVAADLVPFTTGTDTGGSIRQPAAFCGISGIKPSYGRISRYGMVAYASSLDQAGPMARSVEDLAILLEIMAGFDEKDSTSVDKQVPDFYQELQQPLKEIKIGVPKCFWHPAVDPEVQQIIHEAIDVLQKVGAKIIEVDLHLQELWVPCYYVIANAEASSNLARYDGVRYGYRSANADTIAQLITNTRTEGFGNEVKRRILTGTHMLSSSSFSDYFLQALKIRRMIQNDMMTCLKSVDIILGPTTPTAAFPFDRDHRNPVLDYLADMFTVAANLTGLPALSIPAGFSQGLPVGMQLMGRPFDEAFLLQVGHLYQKNTNWHNFRPNMDKL